MCAGTPDNHAANAPEVTEFEATVESVDGNAVILSETYFYAEGGGQPADRGTIDGYNVVDVQSVSGRTVHRLAEPPTFRTGATVTGRIDTTFRTYCMRAHTASHIVYGAGRRVLDAPDYAGFDIGEDRIRIDFETAVDASAVDRLQLQQLANTIVWEGRSVEWYEQPIAEAEADDDIVFNVDPETLGETVRIVEIDGWDVSACGGTHVRSTAEIGPIKLLSTANPGAGRVRVEYAVGPPAIDRQIEEQRALSVTTDRLDTNITELPDRAGQLLTDIDELREQVTTLTQWGLETQLTSQATAASADDIAVMTIDTVGPNAIGEFLRQRGTLPADVVVFVGQQDRTFIVAGARENGPYDANEIVQRATDEFGGGGGGQPTMAQGGGIGASPTAVVEYLTEQYK